MESFLESKHPVPLSKKVSDLEKEVSEIQNDVVVLDIYLENTTYKLVDSSIKRLLLLSLIRNKLVYCKRFNKPGLKLEETNYCLYPVLCVKFVNNTTISLYINVDGSNKQISVQD